MNITLLTEDAIRKIISDEIKTALNTTMATEKPLPSKIGVEEAAKLLNRSKQTVHRWTCYKFNDIPFEKVGNRIVFDLEHLKAWARPMGMLKD